MSFLKPYVARLFVYPIKSLDRVECDRVSILESGAIKGDRAWAIVDRNGKFVNGKNNQKIHALRSEFNVLTQDITVKIQGTNSSQTFNLIKSPFSLCNWLEEYFGFPLTIEQNLTQGFPDDTASPGATIISSATLEAIASWYPTLNVDNIRRRFRANIEIAGVAAFWEDRLFATSDKAIKFKVGNVEFFGVNPCQRCVVVTRDPTTGVAEPKFQKTFANNRKATLPEWTERSRFNHFFRLAINTRLSSGAAGKKIQIGDLVELSC